MTNNQPCKALVTPRMLKWARRVAGMSIHEAADKTCLEDNITWLKIEAWEEGCYLLPSTKQAEKLAKIYQVGLGFLYLEKPPYSWWWMRVLRWWHNTNLYKWWVRTVREYADGLWGGG